MRGRVGVDCVIFAETVDPTSVSAEIEGVDTEMSEIGMAFDLFRHRKWELDLALGMDRSYVPEHN